MAWLTPANSAPASQFCRRVFVPADLEYLQAVSGALLELTYVHNWQKFGAMTPEYTAGVFGEMINSWLDGVDMCLTGTIFPYLTTNPPENALPCDGSIYSRDDYPALYDALDSAFIVDASHFQTPDLRGRTVIGAGAAAGLTARDVGEIGGDEAHTLTVDELPAHAHTTNPHSHANTPHAHGYTGVTINIDVEAPGVPDPVAAGLLPFQTTSFETVNILDSTVTVNNSGGGESHNNMQPFVALKYAVWAR